MKFTAPFGSAATAGVTAAAGAPTDWQLLPPPTPVFAQLFFAFRIDDGRCPSAAIVGIVRESAIRIQRPSK